MDLSPPPKKYYGEGRLDVGIRRLLSRPQFQMLLD